MKKNLLLLASLAVLASSASAAQSQPELVVLPTYVVQAPRYQPAEQQVKANLDALRSQAGTPVIICLELPALKAVVAHPGAWSQAAQNAGTARIAKS
jgi:uncharacterized membrane protein